MKKEDLAPGFVPLPRPKLFAVCGVPVDADLQALMAQAQATGWKAYMMDTWVRGGQRCMNVAAPSALPNEAN